MSNAPRYMASRGIHSSVAKGSVGVAAACALALLGAGCAGASSPPREPSFGGPSGAAFDGPDGESDGRVVGAIEPAGGSADRSEAAPNTESAGTIAVYAVLTTVGIGVLSAGIYGMTAAQEDDVRSGERAEFWAGFHGVAAGTALTVPFGYLTASSLLADGTVRF
jgi:hypothetical protein